MVGQWRDGYEIPVINERAVRAAAGILFVFGAIAWGAAFVHQDRSYLQPFGFYFLADMAIRVVLGDRWSPTLLLGALIVRGQQPEWVGATQKETAWWFGLAIGLAACSSMGLLAGPIWVTLAICALCLSLLQLEAAFGICVGCKLHRLLGRGEPQHCPGGVCSH